jgi:hypothetical protein
LLLERRYEGQGTGARCEEKRIPPPWASLRMRNGRQKEFVTVRATTEHGEMIITLASARCFTRRVVDWFAGKRYVGLSALGFVGDCDLGLLTPAGRCARRGE